ncbi:MAG: MFS transporter, partial [Gammaproteobacteria bacterium]|nr:MFS transporter [Gammaproteobacteria bacterium]
MSSSRPGSRRPVLASCSTAHATHDGLADALLVLLPLWVQTFGLSLTQTGALKSLFYAAMTVGQIPSGLISERFGERRLLALGTLGTAVG